MTEYQVIEATSAADLKVAVEAQMALGWQCQGGVWRSSNGVTHLQAMVK